MFHVRFRSLLVCDFQLLLICFTLILSPKATSFGICIGSSGGNKTTVFCCFFCSEINLNYVLRNMKHNLFIVLLSSFLPHYSLITRVLFVIQYIVESARQRPAKRRISSGGRKSLYQKLYELYIEECEKEPELKVCVMHHDSLVTW